MQTFVALFVFIGLFSAAPAARAATVWNLNDVTYLFPLPEDGRVDAAKISITPAILPLSVYRLIPATAFSQEGLNQRATQFRVVSVRVDPAKNQIRLIWQSVISKTTAQRTLVAYANYAVPGIEWNAALNQAALPVSKTHTAEDYSLHTFYQLTPQEMKVFLGKLAALKQEGASQNPPVITDHLALQVHPGFLNSNFSASFAATLKAALLQYCKTPALIQATISVASTAEIWWDFSGVQKVNGVWKLLKIPHIDQDSQGFSSESMDRDRQGTLPTGLRGQMVPPPARPDTLAAMIQAPTLGNRADLELYKTNLQTIRKFQNPKLTNPDNLDCVHCHIAEGTAFWMKQSLPGFQNGLDLQAVAFQNPNPALYDLSNKSVSPRSTKVLRALGYWNAYPAFNQRVINESAESAAFLNR